MTEEYFDAYKKMFNIRTTQEELVALYLNKKIMSMVHFYIGQEAIAVGVCENLQKEDKVMGNHRSHGHYLARGGDLKKMVCELLGKRNGLAKGKGGSMHMIDKSVNFIGTTPLLGSAVPLACGAAFEKKYNKKEGIVAVFIGDGASEEGVVYESLNLAALHNLPLLLIIENNNFSITSRIKVRRSNKYNLEKIVSGLGCSFYSADGNNFNDVYDKSKIIINDIRKGNGPAVLECKVFRHMAHSTPLFDEKHREEDVLENRVKNDSVKRLRNFLIDKGLRQNVIEETEKKIKKYILSSIKFAERSRFPDRKELYTHLYE